MSEHIKCLILGSGPCRIYGSYLRRKSRFKPHYLYEYSSWRTISKHYRRREISWLPKRGTAFGDKIVLKDDFHNSLPNTLNISFVGKSGAEIEPNSKNICIDRVCLPSGNKTVSHVLKAMGIDKNIAYGAIRLSIGRYTTKEELDKKVNYLRRLDEQ